MTRWRTSDPRRRARDLLIGPGPEEVGEGERGPVTGEQRANPLARLRKAGETARGEWAIRLARWRDGRTAGRRRAWEPLRIAARFAGRRGRVGPEAVCLPVGGGLGLLTGSVLPVVAGAVAVPLVGRALRRRGERAAAERGAVAVSALCGTVAGDLRAGRPPHAALTDAVESAGWPASPDLADAARMVLSAARFGGDVPHALREASRLGAGTHGLAAVAACWQVAVDGGAGLAAALDRVAAALRADTDQRDDLRAQLAGPRSTSVLLALLPLFGVVLGAGLGADPSRVLLHTPAGLLCLVTGGCLEWAGLAWTARIIRAAEGGPTAARTRPPGPAKGASTAAVSVRDGSSGGGSPAARGAVLDSAVAGRGKAASPTGSRDRGRP
ncbi:type II secretion system F family protein [Streptomyces sp. NPDC088197]|uniref:type II secretion system F family protein n=1 Tax=Streptomyces sp. NPDC088197 TaxID=3365840 RepID=UPI00380F867C